ncbi:MAG: thiamine-phosphate kinase [Planctomycetota bacterium]|jgi:thiamine-monophosphate kinase|nr:thiamine-phosphate kinase [Planctomycetota bacterium]
MAEEDFLVWLRERLAPDDPAVILGAGPDDCAYVSLAAGDLAFTSDTYVEGSHFTSETPPQMVAAKVVAATLSDLAASACRPRWVMLSLCFRRGIGEAWTRSFAEGVVESIRRFHITVIGGDTTSGENATTVSVFAVGQPLPGGPLTRAGAKAGDALVVTGSLGGSILGKHLNPEPRFAEMQALLDYKLSQAGRRTLGAAMDISDGLALDLHRLARESGTGAEVVAGQVPLSAAAQTLAGKSGNSPLSHALSDGEDFELLFTLDAEAWEGFGKWLATYPGSASLAPFTRIGTLTSAAGLYLLGPGEAREELTPSGYLHQW